MANPQTTFELPVRGTITSWLPDDSIGRIRLASGEEIRFGHSACVGLRPSVGVEVWVVEVAPHPLGGLRAKVLNATGAATPDRATAALEAHEKRESLRPVVEAEVDAIRKECELTLAAKPGPWAVAASAGASEAMAVIEALRQRMPRDEIAALVASIPAVDRADGSSDLRLYDLEWADAWTHLELWTDPCFVPFATEGGNHLGLFAHPVALDKGVPAPVLFRFHEHDPIFAWVAESAEHFVRMIDAAARGDDVESLRGSCHDVVASLVDATLREEAFEDVERKDVHALFWSGARVLESAAAERLLARYRDRGWAFPRASLEAQISLTGWQDRIDAAWAKLR
ncbi:MAG: hypothetical protein KF764_25985 [Labilithrix sp.]|nr:hypothetical protein [Labilithrix sp.]